MFWFSLSNYLPALKPFITWCAKTSIGTYIHSVSWAFPLIEAIHILALIVLLGTTMLVNFSLLGLLRGWSTAWLAHNLRLYINASLAGVIVTGVLLFVSDPWRYYLSDAFGPKIVLLGFAVVYQFTLYPRVVRIDQTFAPAPCRLAACLSLMLWFGIGAAGRAIAWV